MKKASIIASIVIVVVCLSCVNAEMRYTPIENFSEFQQNVFDYSMEQAKRWKENYEGIYQQQIDDILVDKELIEALSESVIEPKVVVFFTSNDSAINKMSIGEKTSRFMNQSAIANSLVHPSDGAYLDAMSIYGIMDDESIDGISYVVFFYSETSPVIVTTLCEMTSDRVLTKTSVVYDYQQYGNSFVGFAGSLITHCEIIDFEVSFYKFYD